MICMEKDNRKKQKAIYASRIRLKEIEADCIARMDEAVATNRQAGWMASSR